MTAGAGYLPARDAEWIASNDFTFNTLAVTPEDLEPNAIGQLWFWWDNFVLADPATLSPWQKAIADRLRERMAIVMSSTAPQSPKERVTSSVNSSSLMDVSTSIAGSPSRLVSSRNRSVNSRSRSSRLR
jgi:hypothetical protein